MRRPVVHVDKVLSEADVAHVAGRATIVGIDDGALVGVAATVIHTPSPRRHAIARMRPGVYIVNRARGWPVDEDALFDALESGHVAGAGLDVTDPEPPGAENPLGHRDDVIVTPHAASSTVAGRHRLSTHAFDNTLAVLEGRPATIVT